MGIVLILCGVLIVIGGRRFRATKYRVIIKRLNQVIYRSMHRRWRWKS